MDGIAFTLNGAPVTVTVDGETPLLWVLRDVLGLIGTKYGCGMMLCGACTVHLDGDAVRSCRLPVREVAGRRVTTIEGLAATAPGASAAAAAPAGIGTVPEVPLHPVQRAWIDEQVPQCGYCQSGQLMSAAALLARVPAPTEVQIDEAMAGNLCRCGTYPRIRRAIRRAAGLLP